MNDMPERHTIEFDDIGVNILSDAERRTIILQFNSSDLFERHTVERILKAMRKRFGDGVWSRLNRWSSGESNPLALSPAATRHPENPEVTCFEVAVKAGAAMESALSSLIDFLRRQPGYLRTFGEPLNRDHAPSRWRKQEKVDTSDAANDVLREILSRRKRTRS